MPLAPTMTLIVITLDMAGPLPETPRGTRFMLAICDHFTKYTKTYAMKGQTAEEVAEKCVDFCLTYGIPEALLTDRDANFTSQVIESLWERLYVNTMRSTAYHPQAQGITERFNSTIKKMLAQFVEQKSRTTGILN